MLVQLPSTLRTDITLPTSKSVSARALILRALAESDAPIHALSESDDTRALLAALAAITERNQVEKNRQTPRSEKKVAEKNSIKTSSDAVSSLTLTVDIGAAGTAMRFLTAYFATRPGKQCILTGSARMKERPIAPLVDALRSLGAEIDYVEKEGFPPLRIQGKTLRGGTVELSAQVSSQYISALLMIAPTLEQGLTLRLLGEIASAPYIAMTLALMKSFGVGAKWEGNEIVVPSGRYRCPQPYHIEPDWSAASYWYELVALSPDPTARVLLRDLRAESVQGDAACAELFAPLGVKTTFTAEGVVLTKCTPDVNGVFVRDFSATPDLAQTLVVTCALLGRAFHFTGLASLHIKETDRIVALQNELRQFGIVLYSPEHGTLEFTPQHPPVQSQKNTDIPTIQTYDDHRMALSFAPAALVVGPIKICCPEVVSKSYPRFWEDLQRIRCEVITQSANHS